MQRFRSMSTRGKLLTGCIGLPLATFCLLLAFTAAQLAVSPAAQADATERAATREAQPTNTPRPSRTPAPTNTPEPTATPEATATPAPEAPPFEEIVDNNRTMTDVQRNRYNEGLEGNTVTNWTGTVTDVDEGEVFGGFTIYISMNDDILASVHIDVDEETALLFNKGQEITFSGNVRSVSDLLGVTVFVDADTIK